MIEPRSEEAATQKTEPDQYVLPDSEVQRRRVPIWSLLAALAALLVVIVLFAAWWNRPPRQNTEVAVVEGPEWTLVVDMGCEPQELQRVLKKVNEHSDSLKTVAADAGDGSRCWRLVWGNFPDREAAEAAISEIPEDLLMDGFEPHSIELPTETSDLSSVEVED